MKQKWNTKISTFWPNSPAVLIPSCRGQIHERAEKVPRLFYGSLLCLNLCCKGGEASLHSGLDLVKAFGWSIHTWFHQIIPADAFGDAGGLQELECHIFQTSLGVLIHFRQRIVGVTFFSCCVSNLLQDPKSTKDGSGFARQIWFQPGIQGQQVLSLPIVKEQLHERFLQGFLGLWVARCKNFLSCWDQQLRPRIFAWTLRVVRHSSFWKVES